MKNRNEIVAKVVEAAEEYKEFRALLIANPKIAVEKLLGFKLPAQYVIEVREETPKRIFIVRPSPEHDLSTEELGKVAGVSCMVNCYFCETFG